MTEKVEYPILVVRKCDEQEFIHVRDGYYINRKTLLSRSTALFKFKSFKSSDYKYYYV